MKNLIALLVSVFLVSQAFAQSPWRVESHTALLTMKYPELPGKGVTLTIDWDPASKCKATIGVIVTTGNSLGTFKGSKRASEEMTVSISKKIWKEPTMIAEYTGGVEALFYAPPELIDAMRNSDFANIQIFKKSAIFIFPLAGASNVMDQAKSKCKV